MSNELAAASSAAAWARRLRASASSARNVSATSCIAANTVCRYCAAALSRSANAARRLWTSSPPWKSGWVSEVPALHAPVPAVKSWLHFNASVPMDAERLICGNRLAVATPTWALAWCKDASAAWTSGRWRMSFAGTLTGRSSGNVRCSRSNTGVSVSGVFPASTASRCWAWASAFSRAGKVACVWASCALWVRTSECEAPPAENCFCTMLS